MSFINFFGNVVRKKDVYFKYSTDEQWTGEYWIDGKKIYAKVIPVSGFSSTKNISHGISNLYRVLSVNTFMRFSNGDNHMLPRAHYDNNHDGISVAVTSTYLKLEVGDSNGFSSASGYAIIKYIKTS